jgi:WD40 repeat protein
MVARMRTVARAPLLLATLAACAPAVVAPPALPAVVAPAVAAAPGASSLGAPVVVAQRLPALSSLAELSPTGKLVMLGGYDGIHLVDAETGVTRGVLGGCASYVVFAPDGRSVVAACEGTRTARIWDLATDTLRQVALTRAPLGLVTSRAGDHVAALRDGGVDVIDVPHATVTALETGGPRPPRLVVMTASGWTALADGHDVSVRDAAGKVVGSVATAKEPTALDLGLSGKRLAISVDDSVLLVEVETGSRKVKVSPCGDGAPGEVLWTEDELHLVVACGAGGTTPARVAVLAPDGAEERELIQAPAETFSLALGGDRVGVGHPALGGVVFEVTGKELVRVAPPWEGARRPRFSRDLERLIFREGAAVGSVTVFDRAAGRLGLHLTPGAEAMALGRAGAMLELHGRKARVYLDPVKDEILRDPPGELGPDGRTWLTHEGRGFTLVDRATGQKRVAAGNLDGHEPGPSFSDRGAYVVFPEEKEVGDDDVLDHRLRLFDVKTLKAGRPLSFGGTQLSWSFNADDSLIALLVDVGHTGRGKPCEGGGLEADCLALRVFETRTGRPIATIQPADGGVDGLDFTPDGRHLLLGTHIYDVRTAKPAWSFGARTRVTAHLPPRSLVLLDLEDHATVVDAVTGKTSKELVGIDAVRAVTDDGAWMLTTKGEEASLWDTATWTRRPTALRLGRSTPVLLAPDARLAYFVDRADLVVHRFSDGRSLRRALPELRFDVTDEGVFDPAQAASGAALVRRGPDVERSPMGPLSLVAERLGHPGLAADFVAGKSVSPR